MAKNKALLGDGVSPHRFVTIYGAPAEIQVPFFFRGECRVAHYYRNGIDPETGLPLYRWRDND